MNIKIKVKMTFKIYFLTSPEIHIKIFGNSVDEGSFKYSELKEIFDKVKKNKIYQRRNIIVIKTILLASFQVYFERTDFHISSGEALLQLADTFEIDGSLTLKILYALFLYMFEKTKKRIIHLSILIPLDLRVEFFNSQCNLSKSDKQKEKGILIKRVCEELILPTSL